VGGRVGEWESGGRSASSFFPMGPGWREAWALGRRLGGMGAFGGVTPGDLGSSRERRLG
jgi:hypothetical protein